MKIITAEAYCLTVRAVVMKFITTAREPQPTRFDRHLMSQPPIGGFFHFSQTVRCREGTNLV